MSLYGLDIIIDRDGKRILNEVNGIKSGMGGFEQVYGDNRVQERVFDMLQSKYGVLSVNDGTYGVNKFRREHPVGYVLALGLSKIPFIRRRLLFPGSAVLSKKAEVDWLNDEVSNVKFVNFPFDSYDGQESTVINVYNDELLHSTVNPIVAEEISRNKFLQYLLLKDSEVGEALVKSSLVGLGSTNEGELEEMLSDNDSFVVKPILGYCGKGIRFLSGDDVVKQYGNTRGSVHNVGVFDFVSTLFDKSSKVEYIEDLIDKWDFSFEPAVSLIQPFVDSRKEGDLDSDYSVVRAIVCNGKFVDAYSRVSSDSRVNLSQGARAVSFDSDSDFSDFCERVVEVFENKADEHTLDLYNKVLHKKILYQRYIDARGRTSEAQRILDVHRPFMDGLFGNVG